MRISTGVLLLLFVSLATAAELPCVTAEREIRDVGTDVPKSFWDCARTSRVCVALFYPDTKVLRAVSVRELPMEGSADFGIVQSAAGEEPAVCLVGAYSGGSAAAWSFQGWKVENGKAAAIEGMEKTQMNSDAVPPRTLGNAIYGAYVRARK